VRHRTALGSIILLTAICTGVQRAQAGLRFCNQGNFKFSVAVGYVDREKGWVAKGWAGLEGGECKDAIRTPLDNRYYYFYAAGRGPDRTHVKYTGETPFCVQSTKFVLYQAEYGKSSPEECGKGGLRSEMFMKIDVQGKPDYTINLGSPDNPPNQGAGPTTASGGPPAAPAGGTAQPPANQPPPFASAGPAAAPVRPPAVATGANVQPRPNQPAPSAAPGGGGSGACQRYPNLC
jgi:uncharacterized membrane protein